MKTYTIVYKGSPLCSSFEASGPIVAMQLATRWLKEQDLPGSPPYAFALLTSPAEKTIELRVKMAVQEEIPS